MTHSPPDDGSGVPLTSEITILSKQAFKDENEINSHVKMIEDVFQRHVEGINPFRIETLWRNAHAMLNSSLL